MPSIDEKSRSPPREPKAYRRSRKASNFRQGHVTEAQGYWTGYAEPETTFGQVNRKERAKPSKKATARHVSARDVQHQELLHFLRLQLADLKVHASCIAETYRNFGLLFHSFPSNILFHQAILPEVRGFARKNFLAGDGHPLPDIVHVVGTLVYSLSAAEGRLQQLQQAGMCELQLRRARAEIALAERMVMEAVPKLELLRQTLEILCRMRLVLWLERKTEWESDKGLARRIKLYHAWAHALPMVCWEGFLEGEVGS